MQLTQKTIKHVLKERRAIANGALSKHAKKVIRKDTARGWTYVLPAVIYSLIFVFGAIAIAIYLIGQSGSVANLHKATQSNMKLLFTNTYLKEMLWQATKVSFKFTFWVSGIGIISALVIVAVLNTANIRGKNIYMTLLFLPQVTSIVASGLIFTRIFGDGGIFNWNLVNDPTKILTISIILYIWLQISSSVVIYNTAFSTIDKTQYENAKIEGAGPLLTFLKITIPNLSNILMYSLFTSFIGGLAVFDAPFVIGGYAGGDPSAYSTIAYVGYSFLIGRGKIMANVGIGMGILTMLSLIMFVATMIVNKVQPITKKRM